MHVSASKVLSCPFLLSTVFHDNKGWQTFELPQNSFTEFRWYIVMVGKDKWINSFQLIFKTQFWLYFQIAIFTKNLWKHHWNFTTLLAFLGCTVIGVSQGDECPLLSKYSCCGHTRSCKERCVWNKAILLDPICLFTLRRRYLGKQAINRKSY